nr:MAG TPA: hypothetical protein [Caudoviricetes sp.]
MEKQSTIRATIEFDNVYDVIELENGLSSLLKGHTLSDGELKEVQRLIGLVESLTGNTFLSYFLERK